MATRGADPQAVLRAEILGDAQRQAKRLVRHAQKEADALVAAAREESERDRREVEAHAREEAVRRREMILATVAVESARTRAARVEALLRSVHDAAAERLTAHQGFDYREAVVRLAAEAIRRMEGEAFVIEGPDPTDAALGDALAAAVIQAVGRPSLEVTVTPTTDLGPGALRVRDVAGRQTWDIGLLARLHRSWPMLRSAVAVLTRLVETAEREVNGET